MAYISPESRYYTRTKHGEPLMGYPDIYEGREALNQLPAGSELVRAEDGVVVSVMWKGDVPALRFNLRRMG